MASKQILLPTFSGPTVGHQGPSVRNFSRSNLTLCILWALDILNAAYVWLTCPILEDLQKIVRFGELVLGDIADIKYLWAADIQHKIARGSGGK